MKKTILLLVLSILIGCNYKKLTIYDKGDCIINSITKESNSELWVIKTDCNFQFRTSRIEKFKVGDTLYYEKIHK